MRKDPVIAVVGATGLIGNEIIVILEQRKLPLNSVRLFASEDSAGEIYRIGSDEIAVEALQEKSFKDIDIAIFATAPEISSKFVPIAIEAGVVVIDSSEYSRNQDNVPLVIPEVNWNAVTPETKLIANPIAATIQLVPILKAIQDAAGLKRVVVSTYQAVSGAGKAALDELWEQTLSVFNQRDMEFEAFQHQIAFNCIPQIDIMMDDGYTKEEEKIIKESRKVLALPDLRITATAIRVPVLHSHAESVNVETERPLSPSQLVELLKENIGVTVYPDGTDYPMQLNVANTDEIHVGRIRRDESVPHGLNLWIVADNIRKGAALNAVQIVERLFTRIDA